MSRIHKGIRIVCLLSIVCLLLVGMGVTYGRYSSTLQKTFTFLTGRDHADRAISIRADGGWHVAQDSLSLAFSLTNAGSVPDQKAYLRLTATEGFDPACMTVTLTVDEVVYTATPYAVEEGDPLYPQMGRGTEYRFMTDDSEVAWEVSDAKTYVFGVQGETDVSLLHLIAVEAFD